ncbi:MAG: MFS transporter [Candidatus Zhuqueibacterota bacterium]
MTDSELQAGLRFVVYDGLASQAMITLTSGVFLVDFALQLGASNTIIGLLAAIPPITQLIQIPSVYLVEHYQNRRKIAVYSAALSRFFLLLMALIPFFFKSNLALAMLSGALIGHTSLNAVLVCSWNSWMRDLVPQDILGSFFSKRIAFSLIPAITLSLAAGFFIDNWNAFFPGDIIFSYSVLFILGFVAGMIGAAIIARIPEPLMARSKQKPQLSKLIKQPFRDKNFKNLIIFLGAWNFAVNLAAPFFTVYMLKNLELEMSFVIGFTVVSQLANMGFLRVWGKLSDRFSNKPLLALSGITFILCILGWTFTTMPDKHQFTLPLLAVLHIFMGIATAGVGLAGGNIGLKLAPRGKATSYLAANSFINSLAAGIAPIIGGGFVDFFEKRELSWTLKWTSPEGILSIQTLNLRGFDFFFFLAFLIGLYSLHRLAFVREVGEVREKVIIEEIFAGATRRVRNLSSVGGLRYLAQLPTTLFKSRTRQDGSKKRPGRSTK